MIEIYLALALLGAGTLFSKRKEEKKSTEKNVKEIIEKEAVSSTKCQKVVPRSFTDFLDANTKALYEEAVDKACPSKNCNLRKKDNQFSDPENDSDNENREDFIVSPLTGAKISIDEFMEDDSGKKMLPYFGGKLKQNTSDTAFDNKLRTHTGVDKFTDYHKKENKPMFKPEKNLSFINGTPNKTNFYRERTNISQFQNNVLPFKQVSVLPGLNKRGEGVSGEGGFHNPKIRDVALANYKSIDELRVGNKKQTTHTLPTSSGANLVSNRGKQSQVAKNKPETTFEHGHDRLFTTIGNVIKYALRENFVATDNGKKQSREEFGSAGAVVVKPRNIETTQESRRHVYENYGVRNVTIQHKWETNGDTADYGKSSFVAGPNERDTTKDNIHISNIGSVVKSLSAPLLDIMKTTRKENTIGNPRPEGNMNAQIPKKQTVYDTNDIARTTIKETLIHNERKGTVTGPQKLTVYDPNDVAKTTIKETLIHNDRLGNVGMQKPKIKIYDYDTAPKVTIRNTLEETDFNTNLKTVRDKSTTRVLDKVKTTVRETTEDNVHSGNVKYTLDGGYQIDPADAPATQKQYLSDIEYTGGANTYQAAPRTDHAERNARLNLNKQSIAKGRKPMGSNVKIWNGKEVMNVLNKRQLACINAERVEKGKVYQEIPSNKGKTYTNLRVNLSNDHVQSLIDPEILNAYNENPYTHSLSSYAYA